MNKIKNISSKIAAATLTLALTFSSCNDYLDIVPDDGIATLPDAFSLRDNAIHYLYTCYAFMPSTGSIDLDAGFITGDELWGIYNRQESNDVWTDGMFDIARGLQNAASPKGDDWAGIYEGISCCNIFLENIGIVPDIPSWERQQWIGEVKFLKAFYHFYLIKKYGPIPIVRENISVHAPIPEVRVYRNSIDECFDYVVELLDEAIPALPLTNPTRDEWGRITRQIAAALKAKALVYAASPLFNNNDEQKTLRNNNGVYLFPQKTAEQEKARWDSAVVACRYALDICEGDGGKGLYTYYTPLNINDTLKREMNIRRSVTDKWNDGIIWTNTHTSLGTGSGTNCGTTSLQLALWPNLQWSLYPDMPFLYNNINAPIKIAEMFYTNHGLPIENDLEWANINKYDLRAGDDTHRWYIRRDYLTANLNFNREPRFYASLGFDGGIWYGQLSPTSNPLPDNLLWVSCRAGQPQQKKGYDWGPVTGYYVKKLVHPESKQTGIVNYSAVTYPWPELRFADLLLLYAEAINESEGPSGPNSEAMFAAIDSVRSHAGIPPVREAWNNYSNAPAKYSTQPGMREIIHRERLIELAFESQRYWDLRRWKEAAREYDKGIYGYKITVGKAEDYYQPIQLFEQKFSEKDYFWPIKISDIEQNPNLIQNIGW